MGAHAAVLVAPVVTSELPVCIVVLALLMGLVCMGGGGVAGRPPPLCAHGCWIVPARPREVRLAPVDTLCALVAVRHGRVCSRFPTVAGGGGGGGGGAATGTQRVAGCGRNCWGPAVAVCGAWLWAAACWDGRPCVASVWLHACTVSSPSLSAEDVSLCAIAPAARRWGCMWCWARGRGEG
jgi:hypothetical protein